MNRKPTPQELQDARTKTVPDLIAPNLKVLFVGINPGLYTTAVGHHFARPGNRFWPALYDSGFTPRLLCPFDEPELLPLGYGITNVVARTTAAADELKPHEYVTGGKVLLRKVKKYRPRVVAILGVGAYRTAFSKPQAKVGRQEELLADAILWILPNPSGLNASYQKNDLKRLFTELRKFVDRPV